MTARCPWRSRLLLGSVCNRVVYVNELRLKNAKINYLPRFNSVKLGLKWGRIFVKLSLNYAEGKARSVNGNVYLG